LYESRREKLLTTRQFVWRLLHHFGVVLAIAVASLGVGMAGYHRYERLPWLDAFLNAAMLLGGMGPVDDPKTPGGKLFAGFYALYAGLVFLVAAGLLLAPMLHRIVHRFHWEEEEEDAPTRRRAPSNERGKGD
jgi:hypothetical protein